MLLYLTRLLIATHNVKFTSDLLVVNLLVTCFIFNRRWTKSGFLKRIYVNVNVTVKHLFRKGTPVHFV